LSAFSLPCPHGVPHPHLNPPLEGEGGNDARRGTTREHTEPHTLPKPQLEKGRTKYRRFRRKGRGA
jgi:hypothetical protein